MKSIRHKAILDIISSTEIETQHQLRQALLERGIKTTQATLSRDIKDLRLIKQPRNGRVYYAAAGDNTTPELGDRLSTIFREGVVKCNTAMNIIVIKTLPGLAQAASSAIDSMRVSSVVGTVAGDDTVFVAMHDVKSAESLCSELRKLF